MTTADSSYLSFHQRRVRGCTDYNRKVAERFTASCLLNQRLKFSHRLRGHQGCVNSVAFAPNDCLLCSAGDDLHLLLWNPYHPSQTPQCDILSAHESNIFSAVLDGVNKDPTYILSCGNDGKVVKTDIKCSNSPQLVDLYDEYGAAYQVAWRLPQQNANEAVAAFSLGQSGCLFSLDFRCSPVTLSPLLRTIVPLHSAAYRPHHEYQLAFTNIVETEILDIRCVPLNGEYKRRNIVMEFNDIVLEKRKKLRRAESFTFRRSRGIHTDHHREPSSSPVTFPYHSLSDVTSFVLHLNEDERRLADDDTPTHSSSALTSQSEEEKATWSKTSDLDYEERASSSPRGEVDLEEVLLSQLKRRRSNFHSNGEDLTRGVDLCGAEKVVSLLLRSSAQEEPEMYSSSQRDRRGSLSEKEIERVNLDERKRSRNVTSMLEDSGDDHKKEIVATKRIRKISSSSYESPSSSTDEDDDEECLSDFFLQRFSSSSSSSSPYESFSSESFDEETEENLTLHQRPSAHRSVQLSMGDKITFSHCGTRMLVVLRRRYPLVFRLDHPFPEFELRSIGYINLSTIKEGCWLSDNRHIVIGSEDNQLHVWALPFEASCTWMTPTAATEILHSIYRLNGHLSIINCCAAPPPSPFYRGSFILASSGIEKMVRLWSAGDSMVTEDKANQISANSKYGTIDTLEDVEVLRQFNMFSARSEGYEDDDSSF